MNKNYELRENMANFVRKCMWSGKEFTLEDICKACGLSYANRFEYQRVYNIIIDWRKIALAEFVKLDTDSLLNEYGSKELVWNACLKKLNMKDVFFLNVFPQDPDISAEYNGSVYSQPDWTEKQIIDYFRVRKQIKAQISILQEMDEYGEKFPILKGGNLSPKELEKNLMKTLDAAQFKVDALIDNKIKELESAEELQSTE